MPAHRDHYIQIDKDLMDDPLLMIAATELYAKNELCWRGSDLTEEEGMWIARARYVAALIRLWCYADTHINDDDTLRMTEIALDLHVGLQGFCEITPPEWLQIIDPTTMFLPGYCEKNQIVSRRKRRKDKADSMKEYRSKQRADHVPTTLQSRKQNVPPNTNTNTKEEKGAKAPTKKAPIDDRKRTTAMTEAELTPGLNAVAWRQWVAYRAELRKPLTTASLIVAAASMAELGDHEAQAKAVKASIANGYQGLFPPKVNGSTAPFARGGRETQETAMAKLQAEIDRSESNYMHVGEDRVKYDT
jgi:hypothetical protein